MDNVNHPARYTEYMTMKRSLELAIERAGMTVSEASNHLHIMEEYLMGIIDGTSKVSDEARKNIREGLAAILKEACNSSEKSANRNRHAHRRANRKSRA